MIKLLLGLGNPGKKYIFTRHNLGFLLLDLLAKKKSFIPGKGEYVFAKIKIKGQEVVLVKPMTFMNSSGIAAKECLEDFGLRQENLLVACDDANLPLGRIRVRQRGRDGGHNGLKSITRHLASDDFARMRMGIGPVPLEVKMEDFVLAKFVHKEKEEVEEMLNQAVMASREIVSYGEIKNKSI